MTSLICTEKMSLAPNRDEENVVETATPRLRLQAPTVTAPSQVATANVQLAAVTVGTSDDSGPVRTLAPY